MKKMTKQGISNFTERLCDALPNKMEMATHSWSRRWDAYRDIIPAVIVALGLRDDTDPDLIEARNILADELAKDQSIGAGILNAIRTGNDDCPAVMATLTAIKRGRALERGK